MVRDFNVGTAVLAVVALAGSVTAGVGNVNDAYINGDATGDVYQVRLDGTYVPGNFANAGGNNYFPQNVFTARSQGTLFPYLTAFGGPNNNFFIHDFNTGIQEVDGNTGAAVFNYAGIVGTQSLDGDFGADGFLYAAGTGGVWQVDPVAHTGVLLHPNAFGGSSIVEIFGDEMYVSGWNATSIVRYSVSNPLMPPVTVSANTGFAVQDIEARFTSFGAELYASALYGSSASVNGIYKYDGVGNFNMFSPADSTTTPNVTGPHGFAFGPDGKLYAAYQTGTVEVFDAVSGAFLYTLTDSGSKLTDVTFKPVPTPGAIGLAGLAALAAAGRRRR